MLSKCKAIVIKTVNYSETSVILKCLTNTYGLQSYMINGVRKNKGAVKTSHLMPLNLLELEVYHQQNKNLQRIKELRCTPPLQNMHFNMVKSAIAMFMSETIYRSVQNENQTDEALFDYLYNTIQLVDAETARLTNFPIYFLIQLSRFLGFYPKQTILQASTVGFNFKDGVFEPFENNNPFLFDKDISHLLYLFLQRDYMQQQLLITPSAQRKQLLDALILYFNQHISGFSNMKSHQILSEVLE